jgi:hypothetical protein
MTGTGSNSNPWDRKALVVGLFAVALIGLFVFRVLSAVEWDPTVFIGFGENGTPTLEYAEERLGTVSQRVGDGHDGKFFFVQANDPLLLHPEIHAAALERPLYRSQRMLYPLIAGGFGTFTPEVIVWGLLVTNILAMGVGTWMTALVARSMGISQWWGMAFALNPGFISEFVIDGAGILAAALAMGAVAAMLRDRVAPAIVLLALAALTREAMLIAALGTAWWVWRQRGEMRRAVMVGVVPLFSVALWAIYLRLRIGWDSGVSEVQEIGWPFVGFVQAIESWIGNPLDLLIGFVLLALLLVFGMRVLVSKDLVGWAFVGFVGLGVLFTEQVWQNYFDITRAVAPVITAFVLMTVASRSAPQRTGVRL